VSGIKPCGGIDACGGFVDNSQQKEQATRVACPVTGVKEVRNDLEIRQE
jgi:osmotically-inducible protein OsmY